MMEPEEREILDRRIIKGKLTLEKAKDVKVSSFKFIGIY